MKIKKFQARFGYAAGVILLLGSALPAAAAEAQSSSDEEQLIQRIKEAVIQELRSGGALDQEIDEGIRRFIIKQQQARQVQEQRQEQQAQVLAKNVRPVSAERDHILGNPDAEVSIIEYSDFECPFCKRFHPTAHELVKAFDGRVNWVYRHFPLGFHNPAAQKEGEASECAAELGGNEAFWQFTDQVYARTPGNGKGLNKAQMLSLAKQIGLNQDAFSECLDSGRHTARVQEDFREGSAVGITGTPGNILRNNKTGDVLLRAGALPVEALKQDLEFLLN